MNTIRKLALALALASSFGLQAFAAPDLGGVMKKMGQDFKKLSAQVSDASKNAESIQLCDALLVGVEESRGLVPASVTALPAAEQPARLRLYGERMDQLKARLDALKDAFVKNDNLAAKAALEQVLGVRRQGHDEFRQD